MKKLLIIFLLFGILKATSSFAQIDEQKLFYLKKSEKFKRMRNAGFSLSALGLISTIAGVNMLVDENDKYITTGRYDQKRADLGATCIFLGIPAVAGGMVLGFIGMHKAKSYRRKVDNFSFNFNYFPMNKGVAFRYSF